MSNSILSPSLEFLIVAGRAVALLLTLVVCAWGFMQWRRAAQRDAQRVFEQLDLLRADLLMLKEVLRGTVERVDSAAQKVAHDVRFAPVQTGSAGRSYEIAARLARNGALKEELMKNCGITAHEAELLVKLHGQSANSTPERKNAIDEPTTTQRGPAPTPQTTKRAPQQRSRLVAVG